MSPRPNDISSLGGFFARYQIADHERSGSLRKRWRGSYELPWASRYALALFVFEAAAILGRARATRADVLAKALQIGIRSGANDQLDAASLHALGARALVARTTSRPTFWSYLKAIRFPEFGPVALQAEGSKWLSMSEAVGFANEAALLGVALGVAAPEVVERLWAGSTTLDAKHWSEAIASGLRIPTAPVQLGLAEVEPWVL